MTRGTPSGYYLTDEDAKVVLAMAERGDRNHDIAAWYGVNQGRIADVKAGRIGNLEMAPSEKLPPAGPPGIKGRRLLEAVEKALLMLDAGDQPSALKTLRDEVEKFNFDE